MLHNLVDQFTLETVCRWVQPETHAALSARTACGRQCPHSAPARASLTLFFPLCPLLLATVGNIIKNGYNEFGLSMQQTSKFLSNYPSNCISVCISVSQLNTQLESQKSMKSSLVLSVLLVQLGGICHITLILISQALLEFDLLFNNCFCILCKVLYVEYIGFLLDYSTGFSLCSLVWTKNYIHI